MTTPTVKVFTKDNPCTKVDIWNCFRGRRGFVQVEESQVFSVIGKNAPRGMLAKGRVERTKTAKGDMYRLTDEGVDWLMQGTRRYLKNNPDKRALCRNLPKDWD